MMICIDDLGISGIPRGHSTYYEERMVRCLQYAILGHRVRHFVLLDDDVLLENFDRVQLGGTLFPAQDHLAERALAQHLEELKVFQCLRWGTVWI